MSDRLGLLLRAKSNAGVAAAGLSGWPRKPRRLLEDDGVRVIWPMDGGVPTRTSRMKIRRVGSREPTRREEERPSDVQPAALAAGVSQAVHHGATAPVGITAGA